MLIQYTLKKACVSVVSNGSGWDPTAVCCEDGNESYSGIEGGAFVDLPR